MKYISIKEASEKWNVSPRRVQEMCKCGLISGSVRFGRVWQIPENALKPTDGRTKEAKADRDLNRSVVPIPRKNPFLTHTNLYTKPGSADEVIKSAGSIHPFVEHILQAEFAFQRCQMNKVIKELEPLINNNMDFLTAISVCPLLALSAMWKGNTAIWKKARDILFNTPYATEGERRVIGFCIAVIDNVVHDTESFPDWFAKGDFSLLPADSFSTARVYYAKNLYISGHDLAVGKLPLPDVKGLGLIRTIPYVVEPMISQAKMEKTVIPEISLHLLGATVYHDLGNDERAIYHIDEALDLALPDKLYYPIVEYRAPLGSLLDDRLFLKDEASLEKVRELHKQLIHGWTKIHNLHLDRNASTLLTVREREVAKLCAFGLSNSEIASRLNIEVNSVKRYVFSAMNKVGAENRKELGGYI